MKVLAVSSNTGDPTPHIPDEMRSWTALDTLSANA